MRAPAFPSPKQLRAIAAASPNDAAEWETAIHEAGHCVVGVALGLYPDAVEIGLIGESAGRTMWRALWCLAGVRTRNEKILAAIEAERLRAVASVIAGDTAVTIALGQEVGLSDFVHEIDDPQSTDAEHVLEIVADISVAKGEELIEAAAARARDVLVACWDDVRLVAATLMVRRRLAREDLWDLLNGSKADGLRRPG